MDCSDATTIGSERYRALREHVSRVIGPIQGSFSDIVPALPNLDVMIVAPHDHANYWTFVTGVMDSIDRSSSCELIQCLPVDSFDGTSLRDRWGNDLLYMVSNLKRLGRLWQTHQVDLQAGSTVALSDNLTPIGYGTDMVAYALWAPRVLGREAHQFITPDGRPVQLLGVVPIHASELQLALSSGFRAVEIALDSNSITEVFDPRRKAVM